MSVWWKVMRRVVLYSTWTLRSTLLIVLIRMVTQKAFSANSQIRDSDQHNEWQSFNLERPWEIWELGQQTPHEVQQEVQRPTSRLGIPMHWYRLRHDGLDSSPAEKDLKYPAEKDITVDLWVNMRQKQALIANDGNCVMNLIEDHASRLEKMTIPLYLILCNTSAYWIQFPLTHIRWYEEKRVFSSQLPRWSGI